MPLPSNLVCMKIMNSAKLTSLWYFLYRLLWDVPVNLPCFDVEYQWKHKEMNNLLMKILAACIQFNNMKVQPTRVTLGPKHLASMANDSLTNTHKLVNNNLYLPWQICVYIEPYTSTCLTSLQSSVGIYKILVFVISK